MDDPFQLDRFVEAQSRIYETVLAELCQGRKVSHWMWFVFPQIEGLGLSAISQHYAITCLDEARAYLAHPVLGPRLIECAEAVNAVDGRSAHEIFGTPDDLKLRSCLTLFAQAAPDKSVFADALAKYFAGDPDPATLEKLGA
jgi:uncharacterized protein (DUF1810 family)